MTDRNTIDKQSTVDETKEIRSQVFKLSQCKFKTNNKYGRKQTRSPSLSASLYYKKDVGTPKLRSRIIFNGCSKGESPSETDALQDIIWDPSSPPPVKNGKGARESIRVVEISEIVNRIAPNDEKPVDKDSVLQWIGDTAVSCTPDIQKPRVRRCSARCQSNNVEDLMKLAKQFDLNMTRQHIEKLQNSEETNSKNPESVSNGALTGETKELSHEEELHALFDGPTQLLSGRLSPPSTNCSQESRTEKTATHEMRPANSDTKNLPVGPHVSKPDLDDDWENDDLLHDLLEVTQNPQVFSSCTAKTNTKIGSADSRKCKPSMADSSSGSNSRSSCPQSHRITRILSKTCTNLCTLKSHDPFHSDAIKQLPKTSSYSVNANSEYQKAHAMGRQQLILMTSVCPGTNGLASSAGASGRDLDSLWGDADDDYLLYQACDDLERISASQEQQRNKNPTNLSLSSPEVASSIIVTSSSHMSRNSRTLQSLHPTDYKQPLCVLARSHSIPGVSSIHGNKQYLSESARGSQVNQCLPQNSRQQYHFTHSRNTTGQSGENFHHSTFKRHQSDPGALRNKAAPP